MKNAHKDDTALVAAVVEDACKRLGAIDRVPLIVVVSAEEYDEIGDHPFVQLLTMIEVAEERNPSAFRRAKEFNLPSLSLAQRGCTAPDSLRIRSWRTPAGQEGSHA